MAENYNDEIFSYTWDTQANYIKNFGDHSLNALALFSVYEQKLQGDYINVVDMPFDVDWHNLGSGTVQSQSSYYKKNLHVILCSPYQLCLQRQIHADCIFTLGRQFQIPKRQSLGGCSPQLPWHGAFPMKILWDLPANG